MEITVKSIKINKDEKITFKIPKQEVTALTGTDNSKIINILRGNIKKISCNIVYDNTRITKNNQFEIKKLISYVATDIDTSKQLSKVNEYMLSIFYKTKIQIKNPDKKIIDSLKIVGLPISSLKRNINDLSTSEKKLLQVAIALLKNPKIIILNEPFINLDSKNTKRLIRLLVQLNDKYNINIIINTKNCEIIYKYIKYVIIFKNEKVLTCGNSKEVYSQVEVLKSNQIEIPEIVELVYQAKKNKKVMIDYHRDIRDLIKDIYKHI